MVRQRRERLRERATALGVGRADHAREDPGEIERFERPLVGQHGRA